MSKNSKGDLIQMDNIVSIEEQSTAIVSQQSIYGGYRVCGSCSCKSINDGIEAMEKIKTKILDDTFTTD
jgi:HAE1 family hydrophobic/amphiphilic exporter-1/multidrug efflux pump